MVCGLIFFIKSFDSLHILIPQIAVFSSEFIIIKAFKPIKGRNPSRPILISHIKYPGLAKFCIGSRTLIIASIPNQIIELSVLDDDDGSVSPDFLYHM